MKKSYYLLTIPLLLAALLPIPPKGYSVYNGISGAIYCHSAAGCLHEIAHKMDDDLGYPSRSAEFGNAVMVHLAFAFQYGLDNAATAILTQDGMLTYSSHYSLLGVDRFSSPQEELYARLYEQSGGDIAQIPPALRPFYSDDKKYINLYDCLLSAEFKICGLALHKER